MNSSTYIAKKSLLSPFRLFFFYYLIYGVDSMGKLVYQFKEYIIIEDDHRRKGHIIINTLGKYENHGHIKHLGTCKKLLNLMDKNIVPDSDYLRGTALRISLDTKYIAKVKNKIEKDSNRQYYFNPNKGLRK